MTNGKQRAVLFAAIRRWICLMHVDYAGIWPCVERIMFSPARGLRHEYDLVAAKLDGEIVALDALRALGKNVAAHKLFSHRAGRDWPVSDVVT